jgi:galactokinase
MASRNAQPSSRAKRPRAAPAALPGGRAGRWPPDVRAALKRASEPWARSGEPFIDPRLPLGVARAPGRLDLLGGVGDYSGSRVLEWPIQAAAVAVAQPSSDTKVVVRSVEARARGVAGADEEVELDLGALAPFREYAEFRARLPQAPGARWAAYVLGAFGVLSRERHARFARGSRVLLDSSVPPGKGLASSAAIEVAALIAVAAAHGIRLKSAEVPVLAQKIENEVVTAPCGIMDQITAHFGAAGALLPIDCQPGRPLAPLMLPPGVEVAGIDSGVRHDVGGEVYRSVRAGAAIGYRMITDLLRLTVRPAGPGRVTIKDFELNGYLANLGPAEFEKKFAPRLPERISGKNFLDCFAGVVDTGAAVEPSREYPVRAAAAHPVHENFRARTFQAILSSSNGTGREKLALLGELLLAAHESYTRCGLGDPATDLLVELAMAEGPAQGIYGARASGGGSGGTVAALIDRRGRQALQRVAEEYGKRTGTAGLVVRGSSPGARAFEHLKSGPRS